MNELETFFYGKKVLLTGHTGFKGTWMSLLLRQLGAIVCGYSLPIETASFFYDSKTKVDYQIEGDIANFELVFQTIVDYKPEIIIHFASHSSLDKSDQIPDFILRTNIMGVVNVLESARKTSFVKSVLIVTSDKCYKNLETDAEYTEESSLGGSNPYSVSKVCQELISACYRETFFDVDEYYPCVVTARASNVIGPGDYNGTRLLPYLFSQFLEGKTAVIRNKDSIRPWQYVLDVLWGYLLLVKKMYGYYGHSQTLQGAYNFGPRKDGIVSVETLVKKLGENFEGANYEFISLTEKKIIESNILKLDSSKARYQLGWEPIYNLEKILTVTTDFYKKARNNEELEVLCQKFIQNYMEEVKLCTNK